MNRYEAQSAEAGQFAQNEKVTYLTSG